MTRRNRLSTAALAGSCIAALLAGEATAQAPTAAPVYIPTSLKVDKGLPRTPDGHPDFQGDLWEGPYLGPLVAIPLVTPAQLVITDAQSKTAQDNLLKLMAASPLVALDPEIADLMANMKGFPVIRGQRRSRVLVMPADGKMPLTKAATDEMNKVTASLMVGTGKADNPEDRMVTERCLTSGTNAPMQGPNVYNALQIVQTPTHVVLYTEVGSEARIIPFAKAHGPAAVQPPYGDSIAWWEGDTLVIETTNSPENLRLRVSPFGGLIVNPEARIIEKLTRVTKNEIVYQFTIEDPKVFTGPWLAEFSMYPQSFRQFPMSCHEGNYALANILSGARYEEANPKKAVVLNVSETTTNPAAKWTSSLTTPADQRSWAVLDKKNASGEARVGLRIERNAAAMTGREGPTLSELNVFVVDCAGQRLKLVNTIAYAQHNFEGETYDRGPAGDWAGVATRPAIAAGIAQACR